MTAITLMERRSSRRHVHGKRHSSRRSFSSMSSDILPMKSIVLPPLPPQATHRQRLPSLDSIALDSVLSNISDLTNSNHHHTTFTTGHKNESNFQKVFDESPAVGSTLFPPTRPTCGGSRLQKSIHLDKDDKNVDDEEDEGPQLASRPPPRRGGQFVVSTRHVNAAIPQRQASIPCLGMDSVHNSPSRTTTTTTTNNNKMLLSAKVPSSRSILLIREPSCNTFADFKRESSIRDLDSSMGSSVSFGMEGGSSCILDGLNAFDELYLDDDDDEEEDDDDEEDFWYDHSTTVASSESLDCSSLKLPRESLVTSSSHHDTIKPIMFPAMGKSASTRELRNTTRRFTASGLSVSEHHHHKHHHHHCNELLVKTASARHLALRRKWAEETRSASARHLTVHKEEQEKALTETTETTDEEQEGDAEIVNLLDQAYASNSNNDNNGSTKAETMDEFYYDDDDCTVSLQSNSNLMATNLCCRLTACTRWFQSSSRGKSN